MIRFFQWVFVLLKRKCRCCFFLWGILGGVGWLELISHWNVHIGNPCDLYLAQKLVKPDLKRTLPRVSRREVKEITTTMSSSFWPEHCAVEDTKRTLQKQLYAANSAMQGVGSVGNRLKKMGASDAFDSYESDLIDILAAFEARGVAFTEIEADKIQTILTDELDR